MSVGTVRFLNVVCYDILKIGLNLCFHIGPPILKTRLSLNVSNIFSVLSIFPIRNAKYYFMFCPYPLSI